VPKLRKQTCIIMTEKFKIVTLLILTLFGCGTVSAPEDNALKIDTVETEIAENSELRTIHFDRDTILLHETFNEDDYFLKELRTGQEYQIIRENFKRINSITDWVHIDKRELNITSDGGGVIYYYSDKGLEKIVTRHFGETYQVLIEYYLLDGELFYVYEKLFGYSRPYFWDETQLAETIDKRIIDELTEIQLDVSYFADRQILDKFETGAGLSPFARDYMEEEQLRLLNNFDFLMKLKDK
jgi:hypothetical protein